MEPPAFVSYSRTDSEFAMRLVADLKSEGVKVWLDQLDIRAGVRWDGEIENALDACKQIVVILSGASVTSQNVLDEINFAIDEGKVIIPLLKENCRVPFRLRRLQHIDFSADYDLGLKSLLTVLPWNKTKASEPSAEISTATSQPVQLMKPLRFVKKNSSGPPEWLRADQELDVAQPFLMPVIDVFAIPGRGFAVTGRIKRGTCKMGDSVEIVGSRHTRKTAIAGVTMSKKLLKEARAGDDVGILLRGIEKDDVVRGDVIAKPSTIKAHRRFKGELYMLPQSEGGRDTPVFDGYSLPFYFHNVEVTGVTKLGDGMEKVAPGDNAHVTVELGSPVPLYDGLLFAIRESDRTVGAGRILESGGEP
jgi:elongation factor Tu